jgi:transposase
LGLLHELCKTIPQPRNPEGVDKGGQRRLSTADMAFAVTFKVFSTFSGRRFMCDLEDARERGYIDKTPHFNSLYNYLEPESMTPILSDMITRSSLPLAGIETDFAVDSSGFSSSKFVRWFDQKYGVVKREHDWVKAHLICGVKTNIVTAAYVGEQYSADSPQFIPLVRKTRERFTVKEVSADGAYCTYDNFEEVANNGGMPYIAFRSNSTGDQGGTYQKMFHYYGLNRDEYLKFYHKRSNAESTFSMIKAKFGDPVRSKSDTAMRNEVLCKIVCHNICRVIQSTYELGINPVFWGEDPRPDLEPGPETMVTSDELIEAWGWV